MKKLLGITVAIAALMVLLHGIEDLPPWADPDQPASIHVSPRYIEMAFEETGVPNIVTAVLADYRGYDTLGETTVIFTAGMACILLLKRGRKR